MKKYLVVVILAMIVSSLGGISLAQEESAMTWVCPEGLEGQTLRIFNWADYVAEDTIPNFEEACGVKVEYFTYASNEEMVNVIRTNAAEYDLAVPSGFTVTIMIEEGLIQPLDFSKIPNFANVNPAFIEPAYDPTGEYAVPYQWGTVGIAYNKNFIEEGSITTWEDFFSYDGRVVWLDDQRAMMGVALLMNGFDPNSTDEEEIAQASAWLMAQNRDDDGGTNVAEITFINARNLMLREEVDMAIGYSGDMLRINVDCECDDYVYLLPEEGTNIWTDNLVIPANAPNPELAHAFIDYILDPQVGVDLSNWVAYATPNSASQELVAEETRTNPAIYPSEETLAKGFFALYVGEAETLYSEAWNNLLAEMAQ
jgi:spermidine/putrescine transport system substrate-binding protein